jgi:hypothetical protein
VDANLRRGRPGLHAGADRADITGLLDLPPWLAGTRVILGPRARLRFTQSRCAALCGRQLGDGHAGFTDGLNCLREVAAWESDAVHVLVATHISLEFLGRPVQRAQIIHAAQKYSM